jgi:hypothetical protein
VLADPGWNGVLFLNAPVGLDTLPQGLQFMAAGIDPARFYAHHIGFSATAVRIQSGAIALDQTAAFGLIDYDDPEDLTLEPTAFDTRPFAFKTLRLSARFVNAALASFAARVELMVNRLFGSDLTKVDPTHGNNLVLVGSRQLHGDAPTYAFALEGLNRYRLVRSILESVEVLGVQLHTTSGSDAGGTLTAQFVLDGELRFGERPGFDPFSYGPTQEGTEVRDGLLRYGGLTVALAFPLARPSEQTFSASLDTLSFDLTGSCPRPLSLAARFPVSLTGLIAVEPATGAKPAELGYASVSAPIAQVPLEPPWYGLTFDLDLGTLGALTGSVGLSLSLLVAWGVKDGEPVYLGLDTASGHGDWPLQGVLKLGFRSLQFAAQDTVDPAGAVTRSYQLRLRRFGLTLLGLSFPPGNADLILFGNPGGDPKVLGWYAAVTGEEAKTPAAVHADTARRLVSGRRTPTPSAGA